MATVALQEPSGAKPRTRARRVLPNDASAPYNRLLRTLSAQEIGAFRKVARPTPLAHGDVLHRSSDALEWIHFVEEGLVSVRLQLEDGREVETHTIGPEGALGLLEALGGGVASASAAVTVSGLAWRLPPLAFAGLDLCGPAFIAARARHFETVVDELQQGVVCHAVHGIEQRLSRWLLERQERLGGAADVPVTHRCLASGLGVQRTSVTEAVQRLQARDLVISRRGAISLKDRVGLEQHSCACRSALQRRRALRHADQAH